MESLVGLDRKGQLDHRGLRVVREWRGLRGRKGRPGRPDKRGRRAHKVRRVLLARLDLLASRVRRGHPDAKVRREITDLLVLRDHRVCLGLGGL